LLASPIKQDAFAIDGLDLGVNDVIFEDLSAHEIAQRLNFQIAQKQTSDQLRASLWAGLDAAIKDALTNLYNRRYSITHLRHQYEKATLKRRDLSIVMIDLDHFKRINDQFGHPAGDTMLCEVAETLKYAIRASDMVGRLGSEKFIFILPGTSQKKALEIANRLCALISKIRIASVLTELTASIGVSSFEPNDPHFQGSKRENLLF
jgi:two-component system cell cycle response regulator